MEREREREKLSAGNKNWGYKKEAPVLVPPVKHGVCAHTTVTHLSRLIVNTVAVVYSCGQALGLNGVIPTCFCTMFWLRKK